MAQWVEPCIYGWKWQLPNHSINNHMLSKVWDEITYPFPNLAPFGAYWSGSTTPLLVMLFCGSFLGKVSQEMLKTSLESLFDISLKIANLRSAASPWARCIYGWRWQLPNHNSINIHMIGKVWDEITYPFPYIIEVWEWISNFIPHFIMAGICLNLVHVSERAHPENLCFSLCPSCLASIQLCWLELPGNLPPYRSILIRIDHSPACHVVLWHFPGENFTGNAQDISWVSLWHQLENC